MVQTPSLPVIEDLQEEHPPESPKRRMIVLPQQDVSTTMSRSGPSLFNIPLCPSVCSPKKKGGQRLFSRTRAEGANCHL